MAWITAHFRRRLPYYLAVGVGLGVPLSMLPQTVFLSRYKMAFAHYQGNEERPLDPNTKSLIERVFLRVALTASEEVDLEFFTCFGSEPMHQGSLKMRFGAVVGLPATFAYKDVSDVEKDDLRLIQHLINWNTNEGEALMKNLILSDKAKGFAIARETLYVSSHYLHMDFFLRFAGACMAYTCGHYVNKLFQLDRRLKFWGKCVVYSSVASLWLLLYVLMKDTYFCWRDNSVDRRTAALSKAYAEGGVEFYSKLLARNQALRALMGQNGPKQYTVYGNVVSTWRRDHVQLTSRRDNLITYLKNYEKKSETVPNAQ